MTTETFNIEDFVPAYQRDLVYVDYRDEMTSEQVENILHEGWDESVDEWVSEAAWRSANEMADEIKDRNPGLLIDEFELAEMIVDLDTSDPYRQLMSNTGSMLFRYSPGEDDHVWLGEIVNTAGGLCYELGLGYEFLPIITEIWPEIEGYTIQGGSFGCSIVFSANPADVLEAMNTGAHGRIVVRDPFVWLCNPWHGNGWGEVAEGLTVTLQRDEVHVDKFAWGYGANDVFGGLILPDSKVEGAT